MLSLPEFSWSYSEETLLILHVTWVSCCRISSFLVALDNFTRNENLSASVGTLENLGRVKTVWIIYLYKLNHLLRLLFVCNQSQ
jgi:hypothetical protein